MTRLDIATVHVELNLKDGTRYTIDLEPTSDEPMEAELAIDVETREKPGGENGWVEREPTGRKFVGIRLIGQATSVVHTPPQGER